MALVFLNFLSLSKDFVMKIQEIENRRNLSTPPKISSPGREKRQSPKMDDGQYIPTPYTIILDN